MTDVDELKGVKYRWNDLKPHDTTSLQIGLIVQEVEILFPELVKTNDDGYKSVSYAHLVPVLIEAIKELSAENDQLKQENSSLEARQNHDDDRFAAMEKKLNLLMQVMQTQGLVQNENE